MIAIDNTFANNMHLATVFGGAYQINIWNI